MPSAALCPKNVILSATKARRYLPTTGSKIYIRDAPKRDAPKPRLSVKAKFLFMAFMGYLQKFFIKLNQQGLLFICLAPPKLLIEEASNMPADNRGYRFVTPPPLGRIMLSRYDLSTKHRSGRRNYLVDKK